MKPSTTKQIRTGLWLGVSLGLFLIAIMLAGVSVDTLFPTPRQAPIFKSAIIAWILLIVAATIMVFTARVWVLYIAGCLLFAIPKSLIMLASGSDFCAPHQPISRVEIAQLLAFSIVSLFLIYRTVEKHRPTLLDRIAMTFYFFLFIAASARNEPFWLALPLVGLPLLLVVSLLSRRKHDKYRLSAAPR